jgi:hypothetical protein
MPGKSRTLLQAMKDFREVLSLAVLLVSGISGGAFWAFKQDARMERFEQALERHQQIQSYQLANSAWQDQVLEVIAQKHPNAPRKPEKLRAQQLELISQ